MSTAMVARVDLAAAVQLLQARLPAGHEVVDAWQCDGDCDDVHFIVECDDVDQVDVDDGESGRDGVPARRRRRRGRGRRHT